MPDLIITLEGLKTPPEACAEPPPISPDPEVQAPDKCYITLPLVDEKDPHGEPRRVRFERHGDQFVLSDFNSSLDITWVGTHRNFSDILDVLRLTEATIRSGTSVDSARTNAIKIMMAQYIVNGVIRFPEASPFKVGNDGTGRLEDLANYLLASFTISRPKVIERVLGALAVFRADRSLSEESRKRIDWINSIMDLVPKNKAFQRKFVGDMKVSPWRDLPEKLQDKLRPLFFFARKVVVHEWLNLPLRYDRDFLAAYGSYKRIFPDRNEKEQALNFCGHLNAALLELRGKRGGTLSYISECRKAVHLVDLKPEGAVAESIRLELFSKQGLGRFQQKIVAESKKANMSVDYLKRRGRIKSVAKYFFNHLMIRFEGNGKDKKPVIDLDVTSMNFGIDTLIESKIATRREYLLSALALYRYFFGMSGKAPPLKIFIDGEFHTVDWSLSKGRLEEAREYLKKVEKKLKLSHRRSDRWLPLAEGITCAVGGVAMIGNEIYGDEDGDHHRTFGAVSSGVMGAGCGALAGHYLWPKIKKGKVRNRYFWEGASGLGGAILGTGLYLVLHHFIRPYQDPTKFPVDEYGP